MERLYWRQHHQLHAALTQGSPQDVQKALVDHQAWLLDQQLHFMRPNEASKRTISDAPSVKLPREKQLPIKQTLRQAALKLSVLLVRLAAAAAARAWRRGALVMHARR